MSESDVLPPESSSPEPTPPAAPTGLDKFFGLTAHQTTLKTEVIAGFATFVTMAYILVVNPVILSDAIFLTESGDLFGEIAIATAVSAAIATLTMGLLANYPFALAPGMGLNAFFAYSVVLGMGLDWRLALGAVLIEGLIFIVLTLSNVRSQIIKAIPESLKRATAAGIGLFIAYIALAGDPSPPSLGAGIIVANPATKTALGSLNQPATLMAILGIVITLAFIARRVRGALLWGVLITAAIGWLTGVAPAPQGFVALPNWPDNLFGQAFIGLGQINSSNWFDLLAVTFIFLFVDLFDTIGTLSGVGIQAGYINEQGELPRARPALMADAIGTTLGAILGTSTVTTYIESASGVAEGGRTGLTAVVVAILFVLSLIFVPIFSAIPAFATVPALLIVGVLMASSLSGINWQDPAESIPAFLTILVMPLSYSIAEGLAVGFITYPLIKTFQGKAGEVSLATWVVAAVFLARFVAMGLGVG